MKSSQIKDFESGLEVLIDHLKEVYETDQKNYELLNSTRPDSAQAHYAYGQADRSREIYNLTVLTYEMGKINSNRV